MEDQLGLTEHHRNQIRDLLRYSRFKRAEKIVGVELTFQDFIETRILDEDTYTQDEVRDMLESVQRTVRDECESEFINSSDVSALLLRQVMQQADKWKLKLSCDVQQLENRALLQLIRDFEKSESNLASSGGSPQKLTPIQGDGPMQLLQDEIDRLTTDNSNLHEKNANLEQRLQTTISEKTKAQTSLNSVKNADGDDLSKIKAELLEIRQDLAAKEKELDAKFRETAAYRNMKVLLDKKNTQIKELRAKVTDKEDDYLQE